jgi:arginase
MENRFILTPYFLDQPMLGLELLVEADWVINDPRLPPDSPQNRMGALYEPLAELVSMIVRQDERPVSVAGDCCTSLGVLAGLQRAGINPNLIWFDAHGDFNTWQTTPSGFLGGMPLAMLVGRGEQTIVKSLELVPIPESQVVLSDGRDLDPGEREALLSSGVVQLLKVLDLLEYDLPPGPIWVHFDTDVIDARQAPAMNYPVEDGPSESELRQVFNHLSATGSIAAVSLSSWNPDLDQDGRSQRVSMGLLADLVANPYLLV